MRFEIWTALMAISCASASRHSGSRSPHRPSEPLAKSIRAERLVGTLRRECLNHFVTLNARHLRSTLTLYFRYYHDSRTHVGLAKQCPLPREVSNAGRIVESRRSVVSTTDLSGFQPGASEHDRYRRDLYAPASFAVLCGMPLTWLHLTDLHLGLCDQAHVFPSMREQFQRDLQVLIEKYCGPIDLILFTGDMVLHGTRDEFDLFEGFMLNLRSRLAPKSAFLAIPGNHDLVRPPNASDATVAGLIRLWNVVETGVQDYFWEEASSSQRRLVEKAFDNYLNWWRVSALNPTNRLRGVNDSVVSVRDYAEGLLPGDFRCTVLKEGLTLGIIGLNSAFLQLVAGSFRSKLSVGPQQLAKLCPEGLPEWLDTHDLSFLLTHHPPEWLTTEALRDWCEEINEPGRFALHLCGHMHGKLEGHEDYGKLPPRPRLQGRSFFGLEFIGDSKELERPLGYSIGRIDQEGGEWRPTIWSRHAARVKGANISSTTMVDEVRTRRLTSSDAAYFRDKVYPVLAARISEDQLEPVDKMDWWLREPDPIYPDHFIVAENGDDPVGFLYCGPCGKSEYLLVSYLVVKKIYKSRRLGEITRLLIAELCELSIATRRKILLMELAHPGRVPTGKQRTERFARLRLFATLAQSYGFEVRTMDMEYERPASLSPVEDISHLLVMARPSHRHNPNSLSRKQAARILHLVYYTYQIGFSGDSGENSRFAQRCELTFDRLSNGLPEHVALLSNTDIEHRLSAR